MSTINLLTAHPIQTVHYQAVVPVRKSYTSDPEWKWYQQPTYTYDNTDPDNPVMITNNYWAVDPTSEAWAKTRSVNMWPKQLTPSLWRGLVEFPGCIVSVHMDSMIASTTGSSTTGESMGPWSDADWTISTLNNLEVTTRVSGCSADTTGEVAWINTAYVDLSVQTRSQVTHSGPSRGWDNYYNQSHTLIRAEYDIPLTLTVDSYIDYEQVMQLSDTGSVYYKMWRKGVPRVSVRVTGLVWGNESSTRTIDATIVPPDVPSITYSSSDRGKYLLASTGMRGGVPGEIFVESSIFLGGITEVSASAQSTVSKNGVPLNYSTLTAVSSSATSFGGGASVGLSGSAISSFVSVPDNPGYVPADITNPASPDTRSNTGYAAVYLDATELPGTILITPRITTVNGIATVDPGFTWNIESKGAFSGEASVNFDGVYRIDGWGRTSEGSLPFGEVQLTTGNYGIDTITNSPSNALPGYAGGSWSTYLRDVVVDDRLPHIDGQADGYQLSLVAPSAEYKIHDWWIDDPAGASPSPAITLRATSLNSYTTVPTVSGNGSTVSVPFTGSSSSNVYTTPRYLKLICSCTDPQATAYLLSGNQLPGHEGSTSLGDQLYWPIDPFGTTLVDLLAPHITGGVAGYDVSYSGTTDAASIPPWVSIKSPQSKKIYVKLRTGYTFSVTRLQVVDRNLHANLSQSQPLYWCNSVLYNDFSENHSTLSTLVTSCAAKAFVGYAASAMPASVAAPVVTSVTGTYYASGDKYTQDRVRVYNLPHSKLPIYSSNTDIHATYRTDIASGVGQFIDYWCNRSAHVYMNAIVGAELNGIFLETAGAVPTATAVTISGEGCPPISVTGEIMLGVLRGHDNPNDSVTITSEYATAAVTTAAPITRATMLHLGGSGGGPAPGWRPPYVPPRPPIIPDLPDPPGPGDVIIPDPIVPPRWIANLGYVVFCDTDSKFLKEYDPESGFPGRSYEVDVAGEHYPVMVSSSKSGDLYTMIGEAPPTRVIQMLKEDNAILQQTPFIVADARYSKVHSGKLFSNGSYESYWVAATDADTHILHVMKYSIADRFLSYEFTLDTGWDNTGYVNIGAALGVDSSGTMYVAQSLSKENTLHDPNILRVAKFNPDGTGWTPFILYETLSPNYPGIVSMEVCKDVIYIGMGRVTRADDHPWLVYDLAGQLISEVGTLSSTPGVTEGLAVCGAGAFEYGDHVFLLMQNLSPLPTEGSSAAHYCIAHEYDYVGQSGNFLRKLIPGITAEQHTAYWLNDSQDQCLSLYGPNGHGNTDTCVGVRQPVANLALTYTITPLHSEDTLYRKVISSLAYSPLVAKLEASRVIANRLPGSFQVDEDCYVWKSDIAVGNNEEAVVEARTGITTIVPRRAVSEYDFMSTSDPVWYPGAFVEIQNNLPNSSPMLYMRNIEVSNVSVISSGGSTRIATTAVIQPDSAVWYALPAQLAATAPAIFAWERIPPEALYVSGSYVYANLPYSGVVQVRYRNATLTNSFAESGTALFSGKVERPIKQLTYKNTLDSFASMLSLNRNDAESNTSLIERIQHVGVLPRGSSIKTMPFTVANDLGLISTTTWTVTSGESSLQLPIGTIAAYVRDLDRTTPMWETLRKVTVDGNTMHAGSKKWWASGYNLIIDGIPASSRVLSSVVVDTAAGTVSGLAIGNRIEAHYTAQNYAVVTSDESITELQALPGSTPHGTYTVATVSSMKTGSPGDPYYLQALLNDEGSPSPFLITLAAALRESIPIVLGRATWGSGIWFDDNDPTPKIDHLPLLFDNIA